MTRIRKHIRDRLSLWLWGLVKEQVSLKIINVREAGNFLNDEQKVLINLVQHGFDNLSKCVEDFEIRFWEDERQRFEQLRKQRHLINRDVREVYDQEIEEKRVRDPRRDFLGEAARLLRRQQETLETVRNHEESREYIGARAQYCVLCGRTAITSFDAHEDSCLWVQTDRLLNELDWLDGQEYGGTLDVGGD